MASSVKELMAAANAAVAKISTEEVKRLVADKNALLLDVRDAPELEATGKVPGALHVSRGMLEFRADPESPYYNAAFERDRPVIVYCASGGRSALAGKVLKDFGYAEVYNLGGFKDWVEQGGEVEPVVDTGM